MSGSVIPFIDLKAQYRALESDIDARIKAVLEHGAFIMGPEVAEMESRLAAFTGAGHCISAASGTEALLIALMALGIGPGDEVITTPFSFIATAEVIVLAGARPVFIDVEPDTGNIDARLIAERITPRTRAIMPVSLYGQPADMDAINAIAADHGLAVIEDAAQLRRQPGRQAQLQPVDHRLHQLLSVEAAGLLWRWRGHLYQRCRPCRGLPPDPRPRPERALCP